MIKIELTNTRENWIASIGRRHTVVKPDQMADLVLVESRGKIQVGVASKDKAAVKDLQSAVNTIVSGNFPGITRVVADAGKISITIPVEKVAGLKEEPVTKK